MEKRIHIISRDARKLGEALTSVTLAQIFNFVAIIGGLTGLGGAIGEWGNLFEFLGLVQYIFLLCVAVLFVTGIFKGLAYGLGKFLLWVFSKELYDFAKVHFDVKPSNGWVYELSMQNLEKWLDLKNTKIIWKDFSMTVGTPNEPVRRFNDFFANKKNLEWIKSDTKDRDIAIIKRKKAKSVYVFELDDPKENIGLMGIDSDLIFLPKGEYIFHLTVQGDMLERVVNFTAHIDVSFDGNLEIKRVWHTENR